MVILTKIAITIPIILGVLFLKTLIILSYDRKRVNRELSEEKIERFSSISYIDSLIITPIVEYYSDVPGLKTEPGVSYHVNAGGYRILVDLGENQKKEHPSPLCHNLDKLGLSMSDIDCMYISHCHPDHVGGMKEYKSKSFSFSGGQVDIPAIPVFSPSEIIPSSKNPGHDVKVIPKPCKIRDGIYSIGAIPRALYILGYTVENSLAFNVRGKGLVLVIGCGHQTVEKIIERVKQLFDEPIYGIIGGLHLPVGGGRMKIGPVDIQPILGTDRYPWNRIDESDLEKTIDALKEINPGILALSPHDSSDYALSRFESEFGSRYRTIKAGSPIII